MDQDVESAREFGGDPFARVRGRDVQGERGAAEAVGEAPGVLCGLRHVEDDDPGAVAGQRLGDGRADAPGGPGDQGGAAGEWAAGVGGGTGPAAARTSITWPLT